MNLEDFKSFRRVLKPSGVGSIPTHSRHRLPAVASLCVGLALGMGFPARAEEPDEPPGPSAFNRAARSVFFPAWGQLTNGKNEKAAILFAVQTYLYTRILVETRRGHESERLALATDDPDVAWRAELGADDSFQRRRNLIFWAILTAFYGAIDAYVDTYLGSFEQEIEQSRKIFAETDPATGGIALGVRF